MDGQVNSQTGAAQTTAPQEPTLAPPENQSLQNQPFDADDSLNRLVTGLVLKNMPHSYTRDKQWGKQEERWDGIKWKRDGLRLKTKRRKKLVNHGTWKKYTASLVDPENQFDVTMTNIRQTEDSRMAFRLTFTTKIKLHARQSKWAKGVQLYSLSADGKATVRLAVDMELGITLDAKQFPPDLILMPEAKTAQIQVDEFRIDRVSKLGGEFAQGVTRLARREMDKEVAEKETELVEKINKEIAENADDLRLSMADAVSSKWAEKTRPFLPPQIKQAVEGVQASGSSDKK